MHYELCQQTVPATARLCPARDVRGQGDEGMGLLMRARALGEAEAAPVGAVAVRRPSAELADRVKREAERERERERESCGSIERGC